MTGTSTGPHGQDPAGVRFDWGPVAAREFGAGCAGVVVVDVLSFTTSVTVAVERGTRVHPWRWKDATAEEYARRAGAILAAGRGRTGPDHPWSLSPAGLRAAPPVADLVLPSPNGATLSVLAAEAGATVVAACLRNAAAVGRWLRERGYGGADRPVGVVAAGERWPGDGGLRPAAEDLLGAGAVLAALAPPPGGGGTHDPCSAEAALARTAWCATADSVAVLRGCASARELREYGFPADVDVAAEVGSSRAVPVLRDGAFVAA